MDMLQRLGLKKKKRGREQIQENLTEMVHTVTDRLETLRGSSHNGSPKGMRNVRKSMMRAGKQVRRTLDQRRGRQRGITANVRERAGQGMENLQGIAVGSRERLASAAEELQERTTASRERLSHSTQQASQEASAKLAALLAAIGGIMANWEEISRSVTGQMEQRLGQREGKGKLWQRKKKKAGYPAMRIGLLRLGIGAWFVERLRSQPLGTYIEHGAGEEMRALAKGHPIAWYRDLLDSYLIPNASLVAVALIGAQIMAAVGYLTGLARWLATPLGLLVTGNNLLAHYQDHEKRGENLAMFLAQLLLIGKK